MIITYQDKYQVVPATNILSRKDLFVVNRVDRPDDGYAQDDDYFFQSATSMEGVLWLVDCFFERVFFERVVEGTDDYYQSLANAANLESDYCEFEDEKTYYLLVMENITGSIVYERELKDDDLLDIGSYLDEIEKSVGISLDPEPIEAGLGNYNIRISYSNNPEDVMCWESEDYFFKHRRMSRVGG